MKKISIIVFYLISTYGFGQDFNNDKVSLVNFLKRMYVSSPFEGVKIIDDYDNQYLISVVMLDDSKYGSEFIKTRVAQVKAQSQANSYINGTNISMDLIISTRETLNNDNEKVSLNETIELIKTNSIGFSQGLELFSIFKINDNNSSIYIYGRSLKK
jgi:hypothetical protein